MSGIVASTSPRQTRWGRRWGWRVWMAIAVLVARSLWIYRAGLIISTVVLVVQIFAVQLVWTSVYADRDAVAGSGGVGAIPIDIQLAYVTLSTVQFWALNQWSVYSLQQRVREGRVATDLARPVGLLSQVIAGRVGAIAAGLPFAAVALVVATIIGGAAPPANPAALAGSAVASLLAVVISIELVTLLDLTAFWTLENTGIYLSFTLVTRFLSGSLVPLWFMPDWLRITAGILPFQATTFTPVSIYLGATSGPAMWRALGVAAVWVVALGLALRLTWRRALTRVVVQGG